MTPGLRDVIPTKEFLAAMIAHTPVGYRIFDRNFRIQYINGYLLKLRKLERIRVLGNLCYNIANNGIPCAVCPVREAIATGYTRQMIRKDTLPDGVTLWLEDYAIPLVKENGTFEFVLEVMIDNTTERRLRESNFQLLTSIVSLLVNILEKKDSYTSHHSQAVHRIAMKFGQFLGLGVMELHELKLGSLLHDLGKIHIPDRILNKPGRLNAVERDMILRHPGDARDLLINLSRFPDVTTIAMHHHECWDGKGYPDGLAGSNIPFGARLIGLADAYDAMTSDRPYREALSHEAALREIEKNAGTQFDPVLAEKFIIMATTRYPSREAMMRDECVTGSTARLFCGPAPGQERTLSGDLKDATTITFMADILDRLADNVFIAEILAHSPCHYVIVNSDHESLFAHGQLAEKLVSTKTGLHDFNQMRVTLQDRPYPKTDEDPCPVNRAFESGLPQQQRVRYERGDATTYWDVRTVPLEVDKKDGGVLNCVMEIIIDRTSETLERLAMESDIRTLVERLYVLVSEIKEEATATAREIAKECDTFGEYLSIMSQATRELYFVSEGHEVRDA